MVQWVMALAADPVNLSLVPGTHTVKGENELTQSHTQNKYINK